MSDEVNVFYRSAASRLGSGDDGVEGPQGLSGVMFLRVWAPNSYLGLPGVSVNVKPIRKPAPGPLK